MAAPNNTSEYIAIAEPADQVRFGYLLVGESRHLSGMRHLHTQILYCADSSGVAVTTSDAREPLLAHLHQYNRSDSTKSQVDMKILIADSFPATHQEKLTSEGHVLSVDPSLDGDALTAAIAGHEVLIVRSTKVPAATLDAADSLKLVIRAGAGTNTIDKDAAAKAGIRVCNVPGANAIAVAELVMGMMICLDRNIPDNVMDLNNRVWNKKKYSVARGLYGQSVGILGLGSIGFAVAERAAAFGMQVYAIAKPGRTDDAEKRIQDAGIQQLTSMDELLSHCDIITLHLPATAETTSMVNETCTITSRVLVTAVFPPISQLTQASAAHTTSVPRPLRHRWRFQTACWTSLRPIRIVNSKTASIRIRTLTLNFYSRQIQ